MSELQRSVTSFRRQGSSGLVWDDKFINGLQEAAERSERQMQGGAGSGGTLERSRSAGARPYRTVNVAPAPIDPPSPKIAMRWAFCGLFRKPRPSNSKSKKPNNR